MTRYRNVFNDRHIATERDGALWVGGIPVAHDGRHIFPETLRSLRLFDHARLHRCGCGARFIAHHAAKFCSAECRMVNKKRRDKAAASKRAKLRARQRGECENEFCTVCDKPITLHASSRRTRLFCDDACRQKAYRRRHAA